jgi:hypothetical protein
MKAVLAAGAAALAFSFGGGAQAKVLRFTLTNGLFSDGGAWSGWFDINTSTFAIPAWDLTTTSGSVDHGETYKNGDPSQAAGFIAGAPVFVHSPGAIFDGVRLLSFGPNTIDAEEADTPCPNGICLRFGSASYTIGVAPEPASWALLIVGFALAGAALRRRPVPAAA